jgi:hypothetical protein
MPVHPEVDRPSGNVRFGVDVMAASGLTPTLASHGLTAARTRLGSAVQTKGLGSALLSATKRLMASCRSTTDWKTPRLRR